jgi:cobalt-zinc-cadmium efflux system outer membrane protein
MRKKALPLLVLAVGCQASRVDVPWEVETQVAAIAPVRTAADMVPCAATAALAPQGGPLDLPALWALALANNPSLREAAADVEAARGRLVQAGLYPNPRLIYNQDTIGSRIARQGNITLQMNQEIVTAGKRRLDQAVARRETAVASVALAGRKFEVLTRVRRAYYDYLGLRHVLQVNGEAVATLERGVEITRRQVETAKTRPRTDLLRLEAMLEQARTNEARTRAELHGALRQLAAEVGVPELPERAIAGGLSETVPDWDADAVTGRVLAANAALAQATQEAERARLAVERAKAGAVPNVTVGGGYILENVDQTAGGQISLEAPLPVWDRQQGVIREAQARFAAAQAAVGSTANRLRRDTAEAFARYQAASRQVERLGREVLPRLQESLELLQKAYQAGSAQVTFSDLLMTEQELNATRLTLAEARRSLWLAVADLQGLMQLDVGEEFGGSGPPGVTCPPASAPERGTEPWKAPRPEVRERGR